MPLTGENVTASGETHIGVSTEINDAGVYQWTGSSLKLVSGAEIKYIGLNDTRINIVDNSSTEVQYTTDNIYEREGKYNIKVGGQYLYNNQTDGTREANHLGVDNNGGNRVTWGFVEVEYYLAPEVGKFYKIKGDHETNHWLTGELAADDSSISVGSSESAAGIYQWTGDALKLVSGDNIKYICGENVIRCSFVAQIKGSTGLPWFAQQKIFTEYGSCACEAMSSSQKIVLCVPRGRKYLYLCGNFDAVSTHPCRHVDQASSTCRSKFVDVAMKLRRHDDKDEATLRPAKNNKSHRRLLQ